MFTPECLRNTSPEVPDITINVTNMYVNGAAFVPHNQIFSRALGTVVDAGAGYRVMALAVTPISASAVLCFRNTGSQRQTADFQVSGNLVILTTDAAVDDIFQVYYFGTT